MQDFLLKQPEMRMVGDGWDRGLRLPCVLTTVDAGPDSVESSDPSAFYV